MSSTKSGFGVLLLIILSLGGCGGEGGEREGEEHEREERAAERAGGLSEEQLEHGIGPVADLDLDALDAALAARGEQLFTVKCSACHKASERYVGPALGDVLDRRTPEYVMNMILNPAEMVQKHPEAKKLLAEYMTPMPNQSLTQEEARAVLEYLRSLSAGSTQSTEN